MSLLDGLLHRLLVLRRGERYSDEIAKELRFHADLEALAQRAENHDQLAAELAARRMLGNSTYYREEVRRMTPLAWVDAIRQDFDYARRGLMRAPGFTLAIALTLGLGIGVNASVFSFLDALFTRPPTGVAAPNDVHRLYIEQVNTREHTGRMTHDSFRYPYIKAIIATADTSIRFAAYTEPDSAAIIAGESRIPVRRSRVSGGYFGLAGVLPERGRFFAGNEGRIESPTPVAVLSDAFWRRGYQADEHVLGATLLINSRPYTVVGVAAPGFTGIDVNAVDVWLPANTAGSGPGRSGEPWYETSNNNFRMIARAPARTSMTQLTAAASLALRAVHIDGFAYDSTAMILAGPVVRGAGPADKTQELSISLRLAGLTLMVLLIACANVANLLLVRATRRRREIALRRALGVSSARLYGQLLSESLLLSAIGGAVALAFAFWAATALRRLLLPHVQWATTAVEGRTALFIVGVTFFCGVAAGIAPALQATRPDLINWLKAGAHEGAYRRSVLRHALLVVQTALSVVLLVGAGLFLLSLDNVRALDLGFDIEHTVFVEPSLTSPLPAAEMTAGLKAAAERLRATHGVDGVALASSQPMGGFAFTRVFLPDRDSLPPLGDEKAPSMIGVSPDYFRTAGVALIAGREFEATDRRGSPEVVVVSRAMARLYWPGRTAVGQCLILDQRTKPCARVVGVAADVHRRELIEKPTLQFYRPLEQIDAFFGAGELILRTSPRDLSGVTREASRMMRQSFPGTMPARIRTMAQSLDPQFRPWRLGAELFTALGILALAVAAIGVYSVVAFAVSQRTREMGIRIALGARSRDVFSLVIGEGARVVAAGVLIGLIVTLAAGRLVASLLYGVTARDPIVLGGSALALLLIGAAASALPSLRATRVDPVAALRAD
jgi:predicted permease